MPWLVGMPLLMLLAGGATGWFTADRDANTDAGASNGRPLPALFDEVAPSRPLPGAPNPIDIDESMIIGASAFATSAGAIEVAAMAELEIPVAAVAGAVAVDPVTLQPAAVVAPTIVATGPTPIDAFAPAPSATPVAVVRESPRTDTATTPDALRISTPFAAASGLSALCNEVEAGNVPDPSLPAASRPTLAVLVSQPATIAISGTWTDGTTLEKTTMLTLPAHDDEWQRVFDETGEQRAIIGCITLPVDDVSIHATNGVAQLRASVLAISASGQAELNASVTLHVPASDSDPLFVDQVTFTHRGEQVRSDDVLYPTMHVHYSFLTDAVVPTGSTLQAGQVRVLGDHAFVEGADCAGWAANQQGIDRTHSGRFSVTNQTRTVAGRDREVTVVDGDVYLDPTLPGGWQGSVCVRLQATDEHGDQRFTLALRGAQVRSPHTATYEVGVLIDDVTSPDQAATVTWTSASGIGCPVATVNNGGGAQCTFSARWAPDGIVVRVAVGGAAIEFGVPVNRAYCNPDDPLEGGDGCNEGFEQTYQLGGGRVTLRIVRRAAPGALWDDPANVWKIEPVTQFST